MFNKNNNNNNYCYFLGLPQTIAYFLSTVRHSL